MNASVLMLCVMLLIMAIDDALAATTADHVQEPLKHTNTESENPYPPDIKRIKDRGKLIVTQYQGERAGFFMFDDAMHFPDYLSYQSKDGRRLIGHDIEIAYHIANRLGVDLEIRRTEKSFTNLARVVGRNDADIAISKLTITMDRAQYSRFTDPYVTLRVGVLINRLAEVKTGRAKEMDKLLNHPEAAIAVQQGTSWVAFGQDLFPQAKLMLFPSMRAALQAVEKGEALAFLNDEWNIAAWLNQNPDTAVRVRLGFIPDIKSGLAMAVSPDSPNLLGLLNLMIERDGLQTTPAKLLDKYFTKGSATQVANTMMLAAAEQEVKVTPIETLISIGLIVVVLMGIWIWMALLGRVRQAVINESGTNT